MTIRIRESGPYRTIMNELAAGPAPSAERRSAAKEAAAAAMRERIAEHATGTEASVTIYGMRKTATIESADADAGLELTVGEDYLELAWSDIPAGDLIGILLAAVPADSEDRADAEAAAGVYSHAEGMADKAAVLIDSALEKNPALKDSVQQRLAGLGK